MNAVVDQLSAAVLRDLAQASGQTDEGDPLGSTPWAVAHRIHQPPSDVMAVMNKLIEAGFAYRPLAMTRFVTPPCAGPEKDGVKPACPPILGDPRFVFLNDAGMRLVQSLPPLPEANH